MLSPEQRAILGLLALAVLGHGVRRFATAPSAAPGEIALLAALPSQSPAAHRDSARHFARPLEEGELIDVDRASATELARLPRVGPSLAKTIVANRAAMGPFGALEGLDRVAGVGPGLLRTVGPHVTFSGQASLGTADVSPIPERAVVSPIVDRVGVSPIVGRAVVSPIVGRVGVSPATGDREDGPGQAIDLNTATVAELDALPGVGPARAAAIIRHREAHGHINSPDDLARIRGIGPAQALRIWHASRGLKF